MSSDLNWAGLPEFRWLPGMKAILYQGGYTAWFRLGEDPRPPHGDWGLDTNDPATLGCLLHLARAIHQDPTLSVDGTEGKGWRWRTLRGRWSDYHTSEGHALYDAVKTPRRLS